MSSPIKSQLTADMKAAMKAGEKPRLATIRLAMAALKQKEVDERIELDDAAVLAILDKMVKQRRDSIAQFETAGRDDLVAQEQSEIDVLMTYLPQQLTADEIEAAVADVIKSTGAEGMKDMGKVMGALKANVAGRADMQIVSAKVKAALG